MRVNAREFIHAEDAAAQQQLRAIPGFDRFAKGFLRVFSEQSMHNHLMSQAIRLGPRQLPAVYRHVVDACAVLDLEVPEVYVQNEPAMNAYAVGDTRRMVVLTSALVDACEEAELRAVVAHECGHLACHHVLYTTMARLLFAGGAQVLGPLAMLAKPVEVALAYWSRRAEFSADRAAAVVLGGPRPVVETMVRLAGGPKSVTAAVDVDEYVRQADDFDKLGESVWDKLIQLSSSTNASHPFTAVRAREILRWCDGDAYRGVAAALARAAAGERPAHDGPACGRCASPVDAAWKFCRGCGAPVDAPAGMVPPAAVAAPAADGGRRP